MPNAEQLTAPKLTTLVVRIEDTLGSKISQSGQVFPIVLVLPLVIDGTEIIPAGATEPGKQDYWVKNEKKDGMTLLVEEGETQFVRCRIKMGFMSGRPDISPSSPEEFTRKSGGMKLVDDDDMGVGALSAAEIEAAK